jgi:hypothetical protein
MTEEVAYVMPNGREVRKEVYGHVEVYFVQPPNDNHWVSGASVEEVLVEAGWLKTPHKEEDR